MKKKYLSLLLAAAMTVNIFSVPVIAEEVTDTVIETVVEEETVADEVVSGDEAESVISTEESIVEEVVTEEVTAEEVVDESATEEALNISADDANLMISNIDDYVLSAEQINKKKLLAERIGDVFCVDGASLDTIIAQAAEIDENMTRNAAKENATVNDAAYVPDEITYLTDSEEDAKRVAALYGGTLESYSYDLAVIKLPENVTPVEAVCMAADLETNYPMVMPNAYVYANATEPYFKKSSSTKYQWHLDYVGAKQAWDMGYTGKGVRVCVIDTGLNTKHIDLKANSTSGKDFVGGKNGKKYSGDHHYHGTHVAGIIAAAKNGKLGAGVAPDAKVTGYAVLNSKGRGFTSDITRAVIAATENNFDIINMSLGGYNNYDANLEEACAKAKDAGIAVIVSAGNENTSEVSYPAGYDACIAIASCNFDGGRSSFSNYGSHVKFIFPGGNIYSCDAKNTGKYQLLSGTSMAAPCAAGVAAVIMEAHPEIINGNNAAAVDQLVSLMTAGAINDVSYSLPVGVGCTYLPKVLGGFTPVSTVDATVPRTIMAGKSFNIKVDIPESATIKGYKLARGSKYITFSGDKVKVSSKAPAGTYAIYVASDDHSVYYTPFTFTVTKGGVKSISLPTKKTLATGDTYALAPKIKGSKGYDKTAIKFYSSDEDVATVDESGVITAVGAGKAKVYCKSTDGTNKKDYITVTVK